MLRSIARQTVSAAVAGQTVIWTFLTSKGHTISEKARRTSIITTLVEEIRVILTLEALSCRITLLT